MTRNLKALGIALAIALATCAVAAPAAMAAKEFRSAVQHTIIKGTAASEHQFHIAGLTVKCGKSEFAGTFPLGASETPELALEASYENCTTMAGMTAVTIKMNGCKLLLTLEEGTVDTGGGSTHTEGKTHIQCTGGGKIEMVIGMLCTIDVKAQEVKGVFDHTLQGAGNSADVHSVSTITGVAYERTGSLFCGPAMGQAEYTGSITLKGFKTAEEQTGIWIS